MVPFAGLDRMMIVNALFSGSVSLSFNLMFTGPQAKVETLSLMATGAWLVTLTVTVAMPLCATEQASAAVPKRR